MPAWVGGFAAGLSPADEVLRPAAGGFAPVEQCWHLADLEREAFAERLRRLREEDLPVLADFDGERAAVERAYLSRTCAEAVAAFAEARRRNLDLLASIRPGEWERAGTQAGVGEVMLCDLPAMMAEHDAAHRREIEAWLEERRPGGSGPAAAR